MAHQVSNYIMLTYLILLGPLATLAARAPSSRRSTTARSLSSQSSPLLLSSLPLPPPQPVCPTFSNQLLSDQEGLTDLREFRVALFHNNAKERLVIIASAPFSTESPAAAPGSLPPWFLFTFGLGWR